MQWSVVETRTRKWIPVLLPFGVGLLGSEMYTLLQPESESWRSVLGSLYYVPIVIAAVTFGVAPAVGVALAAGCAHTLAGATGGGDPWIDGIAQTLLYLCVAATVAKLAQWRGSILLSDSYRHSEPKAPSPKTEELQTDGGDWPLSRVVTGLAKHFRTPVTSIEGAGWVLEDPQLPDEQRRELVTIVRKEARRLNRVLSDVLDFAQPRRPRFRVVNVPRLVDDVIQLANPRDQGASYTFLRQIADDLPALRADPEQMRQVLLNLVMNSMQAMPGGGEIEIAARVEEGNFVISVGDHGCGIAASMVDRVFDPFFTTHEQSLGLGLSVALRIVKEHKGKIAIDCQRGEGASISVILPESTSP